jgi:hypothetical protein
MSRIRPRLDRSKVVRTEVIRSAHGSPTPSTDVRSTVSRALDSSNASTGLPIDAFTLSSQAATVT